MSKARAVRDLALSLKGQPYYLGEEPYYVAGPEQTKNPLDADCSGLPWGVFRKAGVLVDRKPPVRMTAHGLYRAASPIPQPSKVGDLGFLLRGGHAYHTFMYVGHDEVVEAGDGTGKVGVHTVAHENARGAIWGRLDTDIGDLEEDVTEEEHNWLKELRQLVAPKASYCNAITNALLINDPATAAKLNDEFWQKWPEGVSGLPKGWRP